MVYCDVGCGITFPATCIHVQKKHMSLKRKRATLGKLDCIHRTLCCRSKLTSPGSDKVLQLIKAPDLRKAVQEFPFRLPGLVKWACDTHRPGALKILLEEGAEATLADWKAVPVDNVALWQLCDTWYASTCDSTPSQFAQALCDMFVPDYKHGQLQSNQWEAGLKTQAILNALGYVLPRDQLPFVPSLPQSTMRKKLTAIAKAIRDNKRESKSDDKSDLQRLLQEFPFKLRFVEGEWFPGLDMPSETSEPELISGFLDYAVRLRSLNAIPVLLDHGALWEDQDYVNLTYPAHIALSRDFDPKDKLWKIYFQTGGTPQMLRDAEKEAQTNVLIHLF